MGTETVTKENPLGVLPIGKLLRQFALPSVVSLIVNALYNIVDQIFIGQGVGYLGNAATNVVMPYTVLALALSLLFGDGCAAFFSMALGQGKKDQATKGVTNSIMCAFLIGVIYCIIGSILLTPLCRLTGATDTILPYATDYARVIFLGFPCVVFECCLASIIRADGSPKYSMAGLLAGCITNVILDYVFVFPLGMGMRGAALATILGQYVNGVIFLVYLFRFKQVKLSREYWKFSAESIKRITRLGVSSLVTQLSVVIIMIVTNRMMSVYGAKSEYGAEIPLSAFGITMKINNIVIAIMSGIAGGALPIIGYNYGARKYDRVRKTILTAIGTAMLCGGIATVFFQLFPEQIMSIFGTSTDLYMNYCIKSLRIFLMLIMLDGMNNVVPTCFQSVEEPTISAISSMMRNVILNVPFLIICSVLGGVVGTLYSGPIGMGLSFLLNLFLLRKVFKHLKNEEMYPSLRD